MATKKKTPAPKKAAPKKAAPAQSAGMKMKNPVSALAFSPDGALLAAADIKGGVAWFDPASGAQVGTAPQVARDFVHALAFAPDGRTLVTGTKQLHELDVATGKATRKLGAPVKWSVSSLEFSPSGRFLAFADSRAALAMVDLRTGKEVWRVSCEGIGELVFLDEETLVTAENVFPRLQKWKVGTGQKLGEPAPGSFRRLVPLSSVLVSIGPSSGPGVPRDLVVYDRATLAEVKRLPKQVLVDRFAHDGGDRVAFIPPGKGERISVLDVKTGKTVSLSRSRDALNFTMARDGRVATADGPTLALLG